MSFIGTSTPGENGVRNIKLTKTSTPKEVLVEIGIAALCGAASALASNLAMGATNLFKRKKKKPKDESPFNV